VQVLAVVGDVSKEEFVDGFVEEVVHKFGRLDYCVNCAGVLGQVRITFQIISLENPRERLLI
jgi:NAD(P)-dependent dehydrogenase (short-subunit alcohol dehydrogenase family)